MRKGLKTDEDLPKVDDAHLLRAALNIGLDTDVGFRRLDHIRFMRNNASAAHPNRQRCVPRCGPPQNDLSGLELVSFLQICFREVINTPPDTITANTGRLLSNIKKALLDQAAVDEAGAFFDQLPADRADTIANGIFGLYTAPDRTPTVADNVRLLCLSFGRSSANRLVAATGCARRVQAPALRPVSLRPPVNSSTSSMARRT